MSEVFKAKQRPFSNPLLVHVSNLRQKLGLLADGRSPIQTVRGIGYQLLDAR